MDSVLKPVYSVKIDDEFGSLAKTICEQKYAHIKPDGTKETWPEIAVRVASNVMSQAPFPEDYEAIKALIKDRKFLPGGRYLYASGRPFHQTQNCLLLRAEDSREGWSDLMHKATMALMTGAGIGVDYSDIRPEGAMIHRTGGTCTGPLALMQMVNESGRHIMQGGARRSAIWAGLRWSHPDIFKFLEIKRWSPELRAAKQQNYLSPAPMDGTNISVILDKAFFDAYHAGDEHARKVYHAAVRYMVQYGEPGFSVDYNNPRESLRNAPVSAATKVLTPAGYVSVGSIVGKPTTLWTGMQWVDNVVFRKTKSDASLVRVCLSNGREIVCDPEHPFIAKHYKGAGKDKKIVRERIAAAELSEDQKIFSDCPLDTFDMLEPGAALQSYGLGFVYGDGSLKSGKGELSVHTESKRAAYNLACAGVQATFGTSRDRAYFRFAAENKEEIRSRYMNASFIAGWFDADGCYTRNLLRLSSSDKESLYHLQETLNLYGIQSVVREDGESSYKPGNKMYTINVLSGSLVRFKEVIPTVRLKIEVDSNWKPYRSSEIRVVSVEHLPYTEDVYCCDVGVEEHSFMAEGVIISNCTEVVSEDDSDICNLGSINLARIDSLPEFAKAVELATTFLLAGTLYSHVPYGKVGEVRTKNRRLGLGLMGIHEWLLKRDYAYAPNAELSQWLEVYRDVSTRTASILAEAWGISEPVATRAIAPTGTIGIIAETTTGIEPVFCSAFLRRYRGPDGHSTHAQYVIDPTALRLLEAGCPAEKIEDAYTLATDVERRVAFQHYVQQYVDQSISSTVNLPAWGTELNNEKTAEAFAEMLLKYLPGIRGITCYPDGAIGGQPLTPAKLEDAVRMKGQIIVEQQDLCDLTKGGSCGS